VLPFLEGPALGEGQEENYLPIKHGAQSGSLFYHCCRALDRSLALGAHGLPLMGTGDWNDGMNRVGRLGTGESVWMGFFLYHILGNFIPLCEQCGESDRAATYAAHREALRTALNLSGWDGDWYRRAYFDDGTPLGSKLCDECQIDGLSQSWAAISGAASKERMHSALDAAMQRLVDDEHGITKLLTPAFVNTPHDPGYIKGYVAGVRENGGQYTHAACWMVQALAEAGRRDEAARLLQRLSPVWHTRSPEATQRYKVEPYVIAADIYGEAPHVGRGGWTWYTGSAAWMFRVAIESVLGLSMEAGQWLVIRPRIPDSWPFYSMRWRSPRGVVFVIEVLNPDACAETVIFAEVDDKAVEIRDGAARVPITDAGEHHVKIVLGE
jgi:cyclic beta-1,2-glucan synthetase